MIGRQLISHLGAIDFRRIAACTNLLGNCLKSVLYPARLMNLLKIFCENIRHVWYQMKGHFIAVPVGLLSFAHRVKQRS